MFDSTDRDRVYVTEVLINAYLEYQKNAGGEGSDKAGKEIVRLLKIQLENGRYACGDKISIVDFCMGSMWAQEVDRKHL